MVFMNVYRKQSVSFVCAVWVHIHTYSLSHTHTLNTHTRIHTYTHTHTHTQTHTHTRIHAYTHPRTHSHTHTHTRTHAHSLNTHTRIQAYTHSHTCAQIHNTNSGPETGSAHLVSARIYGSRACLQAFVAQLQTELRTTCQLQGLQVSVCVLFVWHASVCVLTMCLRVCVCVHPVHMTIFVCVWGGGWVCGCGCVSGSVCVLFACHMQDACMIRNMTSQSVWACPKQPC